VFADIKTVFSLRVLDVWSARWSLFGEELIDSVSSFLEKDLSNETLAATSWREIIN